VFKCHPKAPHRLAPRSSGRRRGARGVVRPSHLSRARLIGSGPWGTCLIVPAGTGKPNMLVALDVVRVDARSPGPLFHCRRSRRNLHRALADNSIGKVIDALLRDDPSSLTNSASPTRRHRAGLLFRRVARSVPQGGASNAAHQALATNSVIFTEAPVPWAAVAAVWPGSTPGVCGGSVRHRFAPSRWGP